MPRYLPQRYAKHIKRDDYGYAEIITIRVTLRQKQFTGYPSDNVLF